MVLIESVILSTGSLYFPTYYIAAEFLSGKTPDRIPYPEYGKFSFIFTETSNNIVFENDTGLKAKIQELDSSIHFFASHEVQVITWKASYQPFPSTFSHKKSIVCRPWSAAWQAEEITSLKHRSWTIEFVDLSAKTDSKQDGEMVCF